MLSVLPVIRLSIATTSSPSASRRSQRCDPRKPAPPVTSARGIVVLLVRVRLASTYNPVCVLLLYLDKYGTLQATSITEARTSVNDFPASLPRAIGASLVLQMESRPKDACF